MKKSALAIMCMIAAASVSSQTKNMTDTVYAINEVQILGTNQKKPEIGKLNVPLKFVPISVSTVSAENLEMRGIVNMQDAVKFLPNTRMRTTYGAYQQFEVRGFDYTPIMMDGVRDERTSITNSAPIPDLSSVETIELLKGPASVLYGHSTVGGILNIVRKAPTEQNTVNALVSYGSWDNKRAMIDFGGKFIGPFNYRAVVNWSDVEGYRDTNDKRFSGYFALRAKFDERQTLDIRGGFNRDWYGTEIGLPKNMVNNIFNADGTPYLSKGEMLPGLNKRWRYNNESDFMINNGSNISINYNNNISENFKIENRLAYNYDNIDYSSTEALNYPVSDNPIFDHYYEVTSENTKTKKYIDLNSVNLNSPLRFAYTINVINEQLEASGKFNIGSIKNNYLAGYNFVAMFRDRYRGYALEDKYDEDGNLIATADLYGPGRDNINIPVYNPVSNGTVFNKFSDAIVNRTYTHSVYLQNLLEISDQFKVMLSGRYDYFDFWNATAGIKDGKRKYIDRQPYQKTNNSALTYRIGAVYLPISSLSIYGSFANYFSPYRDLYSAKTVYVNYDGNRFHPKDGDEVFKPQTGYQAEIGTRYTLNNKLEATASAFYIRKNNEKKTLNSGYVDPEDGVTKSVIGQVGVSDSKGFELELTYTPVINAAMSLGYGYTDAKIKKINNVDRLVEQGFMTNVTADKMNEQNGLRLAGIPKNTFFAAGHYRIAKGILNSLTFGATVTYTDNVYRDVDKSVIYPAYWLTDLSASYTLKNNIQLRVNVNNVFNEKYYNQSLGAQMVPCNPTNYLLTISYSM